VIARKKLPKKFGLLGGRFLAPKALRAPGTLNLSQRFSHAEIAAPIIQLLNGIDHGIGVSIVATGRDSVGTPGDRPVPHTAALRAVIFPHTAYPTPPETASGIARTLEGRQHFPVSARWFGGGIGTALCVADSGP
jgi:hypothetical protein